jgi:cell wall-associated NlpC family hydrolase
VSVGRSLSTAGVVAAVALVAAGCGSGSRSAPQRADQGTELKVAFASNGNAGVSEAPDPEEGRSFPISASQVHHANAASPQAVGARASVSPMAPSDAEIKAELKQMHQALAQAQQQAESQVSDPVPGGGSIGGSGALTAPPGLPLIVDQVIAGGNAIADFPYIWGGGHASFVANGYDCSGSVSYALAAGGLVSSPMVSGDFENWGVAGPGRYITVFATAGHVFMNVAGYWFDTAGRSGPYTSRWLVPGADPSTAGYVVRHWPGL